jgi:hypothetical protein
VQIEVEKAQNDYSAKRIDQCLLTIDGLNKLIFARKVRRGGAFEAVMAVSLTVCPQVPAKRMLAVHSLSLNNHTRAAADPAAPPHLSCCPQTPNQEIEEQGDIIKLLGIVVQHQEDQKTEAAHYILHDLEPKVKDLQKSLHNTLNIVWDQQAELIQQDKQLRDQHTQLWEQHRQLVAKDRQLVEKDRQLQQSGRGGYRAFIGAVDREGRVSRALRGCNLDSEVVLNTPAAALCIAAGLPNMSASSLKRVYLGLSLGCHPDHSGGENETQKQLNQVNVELEKVLAAAAAAAAH